MSNVALTTVLSRIRAELDDPRGQRYDDNYIFGFTDGCNEDLIIELAACGIEYGEQVVEIQGVPANTTDLSGYMDTGLPLEYMILPMSIEWKRPGDDPTRYGTCARVDKVRDVIAISGITNWELRSGIPVISPSCIDTDIRVRFFGMPIGTLNDPNGQILRSIAQIFVYKVAQKIASRNGKAQLAADLAVDLWRSKENLSELMTKQEQQVTRKFGRYNRRLWLLSDGRIPVEVGMDGGSSGGGGTSTPVTQSYSGVFNAAADFSVPATYPETYVLASGDITITPYVATTAMTFGGQPVVPTITVKNVGGGTVTVAGAFDGGANYTLTNQNQYVKLMSDGLEWQIVGSN